MPYFFSIDLRSLGLKKYEQLFLYSPKSKTDSTPNTSLQSTPSVPHQASKSVPTEHHASDHRFSHVLVGRGREYQDPGWEGV